MWDTMSKIFLLAALTVIFVTPTLKITALALLTHRTKLSVGIIGSYVMKS